MPSQTFTSSGTWNAPASLTGGVVQVECWGAGGGGGDDDGATGGNGGGGGAYALKNVNVTAGVTGYVVTCPVGGLAGTGAGPGQPGGNSTKTKFVGDAADKCEADFGLGGDGAGGSAGLGGTTANSTGTTKFAGGNGALSSLSVGGGGGSSAGTGAGGGNASGSNGGTAPTGGGAGGNGGTAITGFNAIAGTVPGGAAGGAGAGGAAADGAAAKIILTWTQTAADVRVPVSAAISTPSPPPFPGGILAVVNQFGTPPASFESGRLTQFQVATPSPPSFPGGAIQAHSGFGPTAIQQPPGGPVKPPYQEPPRFQGAVVTASASRFGIAAIPPPRPMIVALAPPPSFQGGVIVGHRRTQEARPAGPARIVRAAEVAPEVQQPRFSAGTHERPAIGPPIRVVAPESPPAFAGQVFAYHGGFGLKGQPVRPAVIQAPDSPGYAGGVILSHSRLDTAPSRRPTPHIVSLTISPPEVRQPVYWSGTHERPAAARPPLIVGHTPLPGFPGQVLTSRSAFGVSPLPARPAVVRLVETPGEPGRVLFARSVLAAPVRRPVSPVIVALPATPFAGGALWSSGRAVPTVRTPQPMVVSGEMRFPEVVQPYFGWSGMISAHLPPLPPLVPPIAPPVGVTITIPGIDRTTVTLCSLDECECE